MSERVARIGDWGLGSEGCAESVSARPRFQRSHKRYESFGHRIRFREDGPPRRLVPSKAQPLRQHQLVPQLHRASHRDLDKPSEVSSALSRASLHNVARHAHGSPSGLLREPVTFLDGERGRQSIHVHHEVIRHGQDVQVIRITHARSLAGLAQSPIPNPHSLRGLP